MATATTTAQRAALLERRVAEASLVIQGVKAEIARMRDALGAETPVATPIGAAAQDLRLRSMENLGELLTRLNDNASVRLSLIGEAVARPAMVEDAQNRIAHLRDEVASLVRLFNGGRE